MNWTSGFLMRCKVFYWSKSAMYSLFYCKQRSLLSKKLQNCLSKIMTKLQNFQYSLVNLPKTVIKLNDHSYQPIFMSISTKKLNNSKSFSIFYVIFCEKKPSRELLWKSIKVRFYCLLYFQKIDLLLMGNWRFSMFVYNLMSIW